MFLKKKYGVATAYRRNKKKGKKVYSFLDRK